MLPNRPARLHPYLHKLGALDFVTFEPSDIRVVSDEPLWAGPLDEITGTFAFRPHFGWKGAIEANRQLTASGS